MGRIVPLLYQILLSFRQLYQETMSDLEMELRAALVVPNNPAAASLEYLGVNKGLMEV
jgi:hypothetical protein